MSEFINIIAGKAIEPNRRILLGRLLTLLKKGWCKIWKELCRSDYEEAAASPVTRINHQRCSSGLMNPEVWPDKHPGSPVKK